MINRMPQKTSLTIFLILAAVGGGIAVVLSAGLPDKGPAPGSAGCGTASVVQDAIIIDHTCTDLASIPSDWVEQAKERLRVSYGHTSHGSQPITGMAVLMNNPAYAGLYDFTTNGSVVAGKLSIADGTPDGDLGNPDRVTWASRTRDYLNGAGGDRNVVIWSWCGQVSNATTSDIETYLNRMNQLESEFPSVTFVYMTGHLDGSGESGNLHQRNNQIRQHVRNNHKVLYDFADIESYDPDGNDFLNRGANDSCSYSGGNWAMEWCGSHSGSPLCASCDCAHSHALNCNLKARAFLWLMTRIAGWGGDGDDTNPPPQTHKGGRVRR
ncbi:MAG: hypothetical protein A2V45_05405 [Candidatus Aminicenantes bacterium RBG_19FT_COMBO_58_17]|nr:MAG: hypothetical protein A2V45_05405 [Candidatus Aminicenantes bacterium RBG_19FT_COMBO_58_17]